ncbi:MAG TPA: glycerol-3-phosphate 1-O-acyltransferase PlsY [Vicinamibacterales bacterium]|nr:glycerol-3-phosphate 1-O-acyltransferase PlsY [Vicinamibacterales bacterium]
MHPVLVVTIAYLVGSVPFAFLLSRRRGIDLRLVGSGNVGATNVLRSSGVSTAVIAMCLDALKGTLAVVLAERATMAASVVVAAGVASTLGHIYPVWLRFRGGKGVATAAGAFAVLAPTALAAAGMVFVLAVWITRFISVGSMAAAVTLAVMTLVGDRSAAVAVGAAVCALVILQRHHANVSRLRAGTERRIGQRLYRGGLGS